MKRTLTLALTTLALTAHAQRWQLERQLDSGRWQNQSTQSSAGLARQQVKTNCDPVMAARMKWGTVQTIRITTLPPMGASDQTPLSTAEVSCESINTESAKLVELIPDPAPRATTVKPMVQLWDKP